MQAGKAIGEPEDDARAGRPARLPLGVLANISCGLLGVQIVWGLQNANTTRIFQTLGASTSDLPILWIAAPITGLLVQPIIGHLSDRTHGRFGRRRPYLLVGALLTALSLMVMAKATTLWAAIAALWVLTASVNIAMQPLRSLMADLLPTGQRTSGFAMQVIFIGAGAVFASALPWMLGNWFGVAGDGVAGVPHVVRLAFQIGAVVLLLTVGWTIFTVAETRQAPTVRPRALDCETVPTVGGSEPARFTGIAWMFAGIAIAAFAAFAGLRREIFLVAALALGYGLAHYAVVAARRRGKPVTGLLEIVDDIVHMPLAMRRLALVQFFTWFGLFAMWVYSVPAIASHHYGATAAASSAYETAANWSGVLFAMYDAIAAAAALGLPWLVRRAGVRASHALCLGLGAAGLAGMLAIDDPRMLWIPSIGIGCAWASILSAPYAIVADAVPAEKVGVYMGIHNIFLVLPQLVAASVLGAVMQHVFDGQAEAMLLLAAGALALGGVCAFAIPARATIAG